LTVRRDNLAVAPTQLRSIAAWKGKTARGFLTEYEHLIGSFHSGGLDRAKTRITDKREDFVRAVASIIDHAEIEVIAPPLSHPDTLFPVLAAVVGATNGVTVAMRQSSLDRIGVPEPGFIEESGGCCAQPVRCHFFF
jgi:hypothetical protein